MNAERFWARVDKSAGEDACWPWTGSRNNLGYGTVHWGGVTATAHRVAALLVGMVQSALAPKDKTVRGFVLHQCDNRPCCNPKHFRIGNYAENQLEAYHRKRRAQPQGHNHVNAKLTAEQAATVRATYAKGGVTQDMLAAQYGVSQRAISLIVRGESYK